MLHGTGAAWCDVGTPASGLRLDFPEFDFGFVPEIWWRHDDEVDSSFLGASGSVGVYESAACFTARVDSFKEWLRGRDEGCALVVGHRVWIEEFSGERVDNLGSIHCSE